jgi:hypothetical protein
MATNNSINNSSTGGLTATGTVNINNTGSGTTTIGSSSSGATNFATGAACTYTLQNKTFDLTTGTGTLNIGTDATVKDINIGSSSISAINFLSANATLSATSLPPISQNQGTSNITFVNNGGSIVMEGNSTGIIGVCNINGAGSINIGTVAGNIPITLGNSNSNSSLTVNCGTGGVSIGTTGAKTINIGNTTTTTGVSIVTTAGQNTGTGVFYPSINITSTTGNLIPGLYHIMNNASLLMTMTLPTTCPLGSIITIVGNDSGGWIIAQNSGQNINSTASSSTVGALGTVASGGRYDCIQIECVVADTTWVVKSSKGTLVYV